MRCVASVLLLLGACGGGIGGGDDEPDRFLVGECEPTAGTTEIASAPIAVQPQCISQTVRDLTVIESVADWEALFAGCGDVPAVPAGLDLTTQRAAVAHVPCSPLDFRFGAEAASELVVGVMVRGSGACLSNLLVVPLAKNAKPVRLAQCREECPSCPPLP
jgi:hypothetical protein